MDGCPAIGAYPAHWDGMRDSLTRFIGAAAVSRLDSGELDELLQATAENSLRDCELVARWRGIAASAEKDTPVDRWRDAEGYSEEALARVLVESLKQRSLALFQASRLWSGAICQHAVFRVLENTGGVECNARNGAVLPVERAGEHWAFRLACELPLCSCGVTFASDVQLAKLRALGKARPDCIPLQPASRKPV